MLGHAIVKAPTSFNVKRINIPLARFDRDSLTRDVQSFFEFLFAQNDIAKLRHTLRHDPYSDAGNAAQRFFHIVNMYKVSYQNCQYIYPITGELGDSLQKPVCLLNFATAALYLCFATETSSHTEDLLALIRAVPNGFLLSFQSISTGPVLIEGVTQYAIQRLRDKRSSQSDNYSEIDPQSISSLVDECFDVALSFPGTQPRKEAVLSAVRPGTSQVTALSLDDAIQTLTTKFPSIDFYDRLFEFLKNAYKIIPANSPLSNGTGHKRNRKYGGRLRVKRIKQASPVTDKDSDSDGEVRIITDTLAPSQTQVPATSMQKLDQQASTVHDDTQTLADDQEISSSAQSTQRYGQENNFFFIGCSILHFLFHALTISICLQHQVIQVLHQARQVSYAIPLSQRAEKTTVVIISS